MELVQIIRSEVLKVRPHERFSKRMLQKVNKLAGTHQGESVRPWPSTVRRGFHEGWCVMLRVRGGEGRGGKRWRREGKDANKVLDHFIVSGSLANRVRKVEVVEEYENCTTQGCEVSRALRNLTALVCVSAKFLGQTVFFVRLSLIAFFGTPYSGCSQQVHAIR